MALPSTTNPQSPPTTYLSKYSGISPAISLLIILVISIVVYGRVTSFDFVLIDDNNHVYNNPHFNPVTASSFGYFLTHQYKNLYVPLSYFALGILAVISRASYHAGVSTTVPGVTFDPHIFHAASVVLHIANTVLVLVILRRLSKNETAAVLGAALFAVHPLQVESVAWISEIRGLLAALFTLAAIIFYLRSLEMPKGYALYVTSLGLAACALLSKPSVVALPVILYALDAFVVGRPWQRAFLRALPFAVVSIPIVVVLHNVQPTPSFLNIPVASRLAVSADTLTFYIKKLFDPIPLAMLYGRTPAVALADKSAWIMEAIALGLAGVAWWVSDRTQYVRAGILIFIAALLPVLGLVPFYYQAFSTVADRYAYLAMLGPSIVLAGMVARASRTQLPVAVSGTVIAALAALAWQQTGYWMDSVALMRHAVDVSPKSAYAHMGLATVFTTYGRPDLSVTEFQTAVALDPSVVIPDEDKAPPQTSPGTRPTADPAAAHTDLGNTLLQERQIDAAISEYKTAIQIDPGFATADSDLGNAYAQKGDPADLNRAVAAYRQALSIDAGLATAHSGLANALLQKGDRPGAVAEFKAAIAIDPRSAPVRTSYGVALAGDGDVKGGMEQFQEALTIDPSYQPAQYNLQAARTLLKSGGGTTGR